MKSALDDLPKISASFKAKYLHAVRRILRSARDTAFVRDVVGLLIEPAEKGVFVIATDGRCFAVIHDADGHANKPFRALLPEAFVKRAAPPKPLEVFNQGDDAIELPEWAHPGDVYLFGICAMIYPKMNHPSIEDLEFAPALANCRIETGNVWRDTDYRIKEGVTIPWREILSRPRGVQARWPVDPEIMSRLSPVGALSPRASAYLRFPGELIFEADAEPEGPIVVREASTPEFVGAIMPRKMPDLPLLPDWVSSSPIAEGSAAK